MAESQTGYRALPPEINHSRILFAVILGTIIVFAIGAINPNTNLPAGRFGTIDNVYIVLVTLAFGFILGSVGNILVAQLIKLRKKEYSFEPQFYMWIEILNKCVLLPDYLIKPDTNKNMMIKLVKSLRDALFFGKLPNAIGLS